MPQRSCLTVVLAAGEGTRMRSTRAKVMYAIANLPMLGHVLTAAKAAGATRLALVHGPDAADVQDFAHALAGDMLALYEQRDRLGTAHAVLAARPALQEGCDDVVILFGDTPLMRPETLISARNALANGANLAVLGFRTADPTGYGRLILDADGHLAAIREHRDASPVEQNINLCNGGVMAIDGRYALDLLNAIGNDNAKGEYYLTDIVAVARARNLNVAVVECPEEDILGINTQAELARAEAIAQGRLRAAAMAQGVSMVAPETVFLSHDTHFGQNVTIEPNVVFGPGVSVGDNAAIHAFCHIAGARIGANVSVGPFARLRPGTSLDANARVGNFVEVKNATVGAGAKINHLSYVGDASVGAAANIGAGTITCNYDGFNKHRTEIGAGAFIGSNSALVAPVRIGEGAYIGSGSVITKPVGDNALALERAEQIEKPEWAARFRARNSKTKKQ